MRCVSSTSSTHSTCRATVSSLSTHTHTHTHTHSSSTCKSWRLTDPRWKETSKETSKEIYTHEKRPMTETTRARCASSHSTCHKSERDLQNRPTQMQRDLSKRPTHMKRDHQIRKETLNETTKARCASCNSTCHRIASCSSPCEIWRLTNPRCCVSERE